MFGASSMRLQQPSMMVTEGLRLFVLPRCQFSIGNDAAEVLCDPQCPGWWRWWHVLYALRVADRVGWMRQWRHQADTITIKPLRFGGRRSYSQRLGDEDVFVRGGAAVLG